MEIRRLWALISKEYPSQVKYTADTMFKYKNELFVLDFIVTYYQ